MENIATVIECPHCKQPIEIIALNCRIFRCGILKDTYQQIDPHLDENSCKMLKKNELIYGCGGPFKILESGEAVICEYI
jgi:hypothetical protein